MHPVIEHFSFLSFSPTTTLSLLHPAYLPDLAPAEFFLFPKMKMQLKRLLFHTIAEIQRE
jgi:hypothetical protein